MSLLWRFFKNKWYPPTNHNEISFTGKTVLVTGSSGGLGAEAAKKFAAQDAARIILAVRKIQKGEQVRAIVQDAASDPDCKVEVWTLDMMDYNSLKEFAERCKADLERLDIAVLNAGVWNAEYRQSQYGWEESLQVNTISTALLALLLLPKLKDSKTATNTPVLEFVSSGRLYTADITHEQKNDADVNILEFFNQEHDYDGGKSYRTSKSFLMCFAKVLASRLRPGPEQSAEIQVMSVCPGFCSSDLLRDLAGWPMQAAKYFASFVLLRSTEEGSRIIISGTAQGHAGHGEFWQNDVIRETPRLLEGEAGQRLALKVYHEIVSTTEKEVPETRSLALD
ncbi:MAG: hypothetical protein Q9159_006404 [Coniocarpon cinnabarinum]